MAKLVILLNGLGQPWPRAYWLVLMVMIVLRVRF